VSGGSGLPVGEARFLVTTYEAGVCCDFPIAESTNRQPADDWSNVFDWGDGTGQRPATRHNAQSNPNPPYVHPGTWQLWDETHAYANPGIYSARVTVRIHVFGWPPGTIPYPSPITSIAVYPRVPIAALVIEPSAAAVGDVVRVEIRLVEPASPAGTSVDLVADPIGAFENLPACVRVPPGRTELVLSYKLAPPSAGRRVRLTASSVGTPRSDEVQVRP
jgi:hypothetical protein